MTDLIIINPATPEDEAAIHSILIGVKHGVEKANAEYDVSQFTIEVDDKFKKTMIEAIEKTFFENNINADIS